VAVVAIRLWLAGHEVAFDHMGISSLGYAKNMQSISLSFCPAFLDPDSRNNT